MLSQGCHSRCLFDAWELRLSWDEEDVAGEVLTRSCGLGVPLKCHVESNPLIVDE